DRVAALADEELCGCDVDRPGALQGANAVDTAVGEMAERKCERAEDAQAVHQADEGWCVLRDQVGARRLEREQLDLVLRRVTVERRAGHFRAGAAFSRPPP